MPTVNAKSRGYEKIKGAARAFNFDFRDKVVLDIGSSTGGFTQYALEQGAKKIIAVEKGTNQMMSPLRFDKKIELHEKTDVFDVKTQIDAFRGNPEPGKARTSARAPWRRERATRPDESTICVSPPDIILADVSFISLKQVLAYAKQNLAHRDTKFLVMLKPQFEANKTQLNKGIIKNEKTRRLVIKDFETWLKNNSFLIINKRDNQLKGKSGNQERFYYLTLAK